MTASDFITKLKACLPGAKKIVLSREKIAPLYLPFDDGFHDGYENGVDSSFDIFEKLIDNVEKSLQ